MQPHLLLESRWKEKRSVSINNDSAIIILLHSILHVFIIQFIFTHCIHLADKTASRSGSSDSTSANDSPARAGQRRTHPSSTTGDGPTTEPPDKGIK